MGVFEIFNGRFQKVNIFIQSKTVLQMGGCMLSRVDESDIDYALDDHFKKTKSLYEANSSINPQYIDVILQLPELLSLTKDIGQLAYPFDCVGTVIFQFYLDNDYGYKYPVPGRGYGVLISPNLVLTGAENIYSKKRKQQFSNVLFMPSRSEKVYEVQSCSYSEKYVSQQKPLESLKSNFALLLLKQSIRRPKYPRIGSDYSLDKLQKLFGEVDVGNLSADIVQTYAYNEERNNILEITKEGIIHHTFPTHLELFGGPIFLQIYDEYYVIGIHCYYEKLIKSIYDKHKNDTVYSVGLLINEARANTITKMCEKLIQIYNQHQLQFEKVQNKLDIKTSASKETKENKLIQNTLNSKDQPTLLLEPNDNDYVFQFEESEIINEVKPVNFNINFENQYYFNKKQNNILKAQHKLYAIATTQSPNVLLDIDSFNNTKMTFLEKLNYGFTYYVNQNYQEAREFFMSGLDAYKKKGTCEDKDVKINAYLFYLAGKCDFHLQKYKNSFKNLTEAWIMFSEMDNDYLRIEENLTLNCAMGLIYHKIRDPIKADEFYHQALDIARDFEGNGVKAAIILNNLGCLHCQEKQYKSSLHFFQESIDIYQPLREFQKEKHQVCHNLAVTYTKMKNFQSPIVTYADIFEDLFKEKESEDFKKQFQIYKIRFCRFLEHIADNQMIKEQQIHFGLRIAHKYNIVLGWYEKKPQVQRFSMSIPSAPSVPSIKPLK